jgi:hypothetical protein
LLLLALPVQAITFYFSDASSGLRGLMTVAGVATVPVFISLLLNHQISAATLVAYCGLTFAAVRAAGFITGSAYRKALLSDEELFVEAFGERACTLRDNESERVYSTSAASAREPAAR